ncbi:uncharacterized protein PF3D7_1120000-like [Palaemon carinicauda]|uniref:uncharacterized protein PF3D7_1120000-like n=1 Tax=Palaemon carinicauda TaxID=392227 RepID=UPI0035B640E7
MNPSPLDPHLNPLPVLEARYLQLESLSIDPNLSPNANATHNENRDAKIERNSKEKIKREKRDSVRRQVAFSTGQHKVLEHTKPAFQGVWEEYSVKRILYELKMRIIDQLNAQIRALGSTTVDKALKGHLGVHANNLKRALEIEDMEERLRFVAKCNCQKDPNFKYSLLRPGVIRGKLHVQNKSERNEPLDKIPLWGTKLPQPAQRHSPPLIGFSSEEDVKEHTHQPFVQWDLKKEKSEELNSCDWRKNKPFVDGTKPELSKVKGFEEMNKEIMDLRRKNENLKEQLEKKMTKVSQLDIMEREYKVLKENCDKLTEENRHLQREIADLKEQCPNNLANVSKIESRFREGEILRKNNERLAEENRRLQQEVADLKESVLQDEILRKNNERLAEENRRLQQEVSEYRREEEMKESTRDIILRINEELVRKNKSLEDCMKGRNELEGENWHLRQNVAELERQVKAENQENHSTRDLILKENKDL